MAEFVITVTKDATAPVQYTHVPSANLDFEETHGEFKWRWGQAADIAPQHRDEHLQAISEITVSKASGLVTVRTDRFGLFPVLVFEDDAKIILASHNTPFKTAYPNLAKPNATALNQILALGQCLDEETLITGLRHLPANHEFMWEGDEGDVKNFDAKPSRKQTGPRGAIDTFVEAVDRRLRNNPDMLVPLSGGLDTRLILAAVMASGHKPETFSYGNPEAADTQISAELAKVAGLEHRTFPLGQGDLESAVPRIANVGGGEIPIHHGHGFISTDVLEATKGRAIMTGTGGETYRAFYLNRGIPGMGVFDMKTFKRKLMPRAARYVTDHYTTAGTAFKNLRYEEAMEAIQDLNKNIQTLALKSHSAAHMTEQVYLTMRMRRFILNGQRALDFNNDRSHPFLDMKVFDTWSRLPIALKQYSEMHREAILKLAPALGEITWDQTMKPLNAGLSMSEKYPGLMNRLGLKASYAKAGAKMFNYEALQAADNGQLEVLGISATAEMMEDLHIRGTLRAASEFFNS